MTEGARTVLVIGGGASGVLLTLQLLRASPDLKVMLIERGETLGRGLAYATGDDQHLLNVPPLALSAFPDDPEHFWRWLHETHRIRAGADPFVFVARHYFGEYLAAVLADAASAAGPGRLAIVHGDVAALQQTARGIEAQLANGTSVPGHLAVLATGHDDDCPADEAVLGIDPQDPLPVMILGTGLSMVDRWLSLRHAGYRGTIVALSRRGLLPQRHTGVAPLRLDAADIPFGTGLPYFARWLRQTARQALIECGDWRAATDALRPFSQRLWQSWSLATRRRFLTHGRAWWDVHRHRLAPAVHARMAEEVRAGGLTTVAAKPVALRPGVGRQRVTYRRRGAVATEEMEVAAVLDCRGIARDWEARPETLAGRLIANGCARTDPLRLGLDVSPGCEVLDSHGTASARLYAVGPLTRGTFFEIEAIPDIRNQCVAVADAVADRVLRQSL